MKEPLTSLLDLFYPRVCAACNGPVQSGEHQLCWDCLSRIITLKSPFCSLCGNPVSGRIDHAYTCWHCLEYPKSFDKARSFALYDGVAATCLRLLKYRQGFWVLPDTVQWLEACVRMHWEVDDIDLVCAVPLHPVRRLQRGFNQAALLGSRLSVVLQKPFLRRGLKRVKKTGTQTRLTAGARMDNVKDAFRVLKGRRLDGRNVLLVDDVMTTGATASECAVALKCAGARQVQVVTVARSFY